MKGSIRGLQAAQAAANQAAAAVTAGGALGRAVKYITAREHRYAVSINPVDTGSWRASHRQTIESSGLRGHVFLQPGATNSRTGGPVSRYAGMYEARRGRYAVYLRTFEEDGRKALDAGGDIVRGALP
jgi:hypothetical protein